MAGTTNNRRYPFPGQLDADNVPSDIQALAEAVDTDVASVKTTADSTKTLLNTLLGGKRIVAGFYSLNLPASPVNANGTISFGVTFSSPPWVFTQIDSGVGGSDKVIVRTNSYGATTTSIPVFYTNNSGLAISGMRFAWLAIGAA